MTVARAGEERSEGQNTRTSGHVEDRATQLQPRSPPAVREPLCGALSASPKENSMNRSAFLNAGRAIPLMAAAALLVVSCGGDGSTPGTPGLDGSPEAATEQLVSLISQGDWGREWDSLHPEQQKYVERDKFISCTKGSDSARVQGVDVLEVYDDEMVIPGTDVRSPSKAVNVKLKVTQKAFKTTDVQDTIQLFQVDGRWRWVLPNIEAYKSGSCPD